MSEIINSYMEPVGFFKSSDFLSGSIEEFNEYEMIDNTDRVLKLLFDQDIPDNYMVWRDFSLIGYPSFIFMRIIKSRKGYP
ncbi:hypothetical protein CE143_01650 [Photorhabdus luminescens]|uniref:Uncharacterized protein n=1 Tax=Photorhabdus akhurstii TaxID=171438 RepID=A0ABX8LNZ5_9GAMM|nr:hypothetical protein [Photorhabdus akhurstii]QXF32021.1 hypothetical protein B0X70_01665 [Photorhabdus akhurstii]UJD73815.1 hypothetical protein CE143_01650 [Photorhabdus luminescens]